MQKKASVWQLCRLCVFPGILRIVPRIISRQLMLVMKLIVVLLTAALLNVHAAGRAQTVTISGKDLSLKKIIAVIEAQTGFAVFGNMDVLKGAKPVSIDADRMPLREFLNLVMKEQPLHFRIDGKDIIFSRKPAAALDMYLGTIPITGSVSSAGGRALPGASIKIRGTSIGTTSDQYGEFSLDVEPGQVLVVSYTGYQPVEYKVGKEKNVSISLIPMESRLNEVIVNAGYYTVKQKLSTGSIGKVDAATIGQQPVSNPLEALNGRVSGIYIQQYSGMPGSNFQVRIRGTNSLRNGNNPLYIINGVPFSAETLSDVNTSSGYRDGVSPLNSINPNDIESIEVLKDADATAIYGSRGANGVILITTKKGSNSKPRVDVNVYAGGGIVTQYMDLMNTQEYIAMRKEAKANDGTVVQAYEHDINGNWDPNRYTNWQKELLGGVAEELNANVSISGGNEETQFLLNGGYEDRNNVFPGPNYARKFSTHFSIHHTSANKKFNARVSTIYAINNTRIGVSDLTSVALTLPPNAPALYDSVGKLNWDRNRWDNPLALQEAKFIANVYNLLTNAELSYKIIDGLSVSTSIGINDRRNEETRTSPSTQYNPRFGETPASSRLTIGGGKDRLWIIEPKINWDREFGLLKVSVLTGSTFQKQIREDARNIYRGFLSDQSIENPKAASTASLDTYNYTEYRYNALYGRINLNWDDRYIINATGRRDGSSRFGPGRQFANLGAIGLAWLFSNENFAMQHLPFLSHGKLRLSFGITGNDQIGDYRYLNTYRAQGSYQGSTSLMPTRLFNPDYGWETNVKKEAAIELGFIKDRIMLNVGYFYNRSSNQLLDYRLASTTGFLNVNRNFPATVRNTGVEIGLTTVNIRSRQILWETDLNFTIPRNKLVSFPGLKASSYASTYEEGMPLNIRKMFAYTGIDPQTGLYQFADLDGDGNVDYRDRLKAVETGQRMFGGMNNRVVIKGLEINVFLQFVKQYQGKYMNYTIPGSPGAGTGNQPAYVLGQQWQKPGDNTEYQYFTASFDGPAVERYSMYQSSDAVIKDLSFVRLRTVSMSYRLPNDLVKGVKSRFYLQAQNLLKFSKYSGLDPETGATSLPPLAMLTAGIQLTF